MIILIIGVGFIFGFIVTRWVKQEGGFGLQGNIVVGVIGAFIGEILPQMLGIYIRSVADVLLFSVTGAVTLFFIVNLIKRQVVSNDYKSSPNRQPPNDILSGSDSLTKLLKNLFPSENKSSTVSETPPAHQSTEPKQTNVRKIFVSYRRDDSSDVAGRIYDQLVDSFGKTRIFRDIDTIPFGVDFRKYIQEAVAQADVLLAIIGPRWHGDNATQTTTRLDNPKDFVRIELAVALDKDIPVIPVLVSGAKMPDESDLPAVLASFSYRNAIQIRPDPDFHNDMDRLISGIKALMDFSMGTPPPS